MVGISLFWLLAFDAPVTAQLDTGGSISGYVTDEAGGALADVVVTVSGEEAAERHEALTDRAGFYRLLHLPPAAYNVALMRSGFAPIVRDAVFVREALNLRLDAVLTLATSELVVVPGDPPILERSTAVQATNVAGAFLRELPSSGLRSWGDLLLLAPSVVTTHARFQTHSLHGTTSASGVFLVDGADASSVLQGSTLYSQFGREVFADVHVTTGATPPSSPLGLGAVVTIATPAATNELRGAASLVYQPRSWNDDNAPAGQSLTTAVRQPELSIGGPVRRDRWWFFADATLARNHTGTPRSAQQVDYLRRLAPGFAEFDNIWQGSSVFGKATGRLSPAHHWLASYHRSEFRHGGAQAGEAAPFRDVVLGGPTYHARLSSAWSETLLTRLSVGFNGKRQRTVNRHPEKTGVNVFERVFASGGRLVGSGLLATLEGSPFNGTDFPVSMWTIAADATWYRDRWAGSHELRAGLYLQPRRHNQWNATYDNGGFQVEDVVLRDPGDFSRGVVPFHRRVYDVDGLTVLNVDTRDAAVHVEDTWRPGPRATIHGGVRVDLVKRVDRLFDVVVQDSVEVGPRLGLNYMLTADGRNLVRVGWSRIHEHLSVNETSAGTNAAGFTDVYDTAGDGSFASSFVTQGVSGPAAIVSVDLDRYHQAFADELTVGYRRQLSRQSSAGAAFVRRDYRDRPTLVEVNGVYDGSVFTGFRDPRVNEQYVLTANRWNHPIASALIVDAAGTARGLQGSVAYTWTRSRLAGGWQPNDPASFLQPDAFPNRNGIGFVNGCTAPPCADGDGLSLTASGGPWRSHLLQVAASYHLRGVSIATMYTAASGPWSGPILTRLAAPDPRFGPPTVTLSNGRVVSNPLATPVRFAHPTRGDGQFTLGAMHLWNVRVGGGVAFGGRRLAVTFDVLNLTNHGADQLFQIGGNQQGTPFFGRGLSRQFPRAAQLSARFAF